jgi:hypothetical protein
MNIFLRSMTDQDIPFIFSSWLKSYKNTQSHVDSDIYYKGQHKLIELILSNSSVLIASLDDDPETILGYTVFSVDTLHWIYVKSTYRNMGFATTMLNIAFQNKSPTYYSHFTPATYFLFKDKVRFNPYSYLENI